MPMLLKSEDGPEFELAIIEDRFDDPQDGFGDAGWLTLAFRVATEDEALWVICAVTQFYREDAWYLERIYKWMDRIGLAAIKAAVEDPEVRRALYDRVTYSQRFYRIDPWAERVAGRHADEFSPLTRTMELA